MERDPGHRATAPEPYPLRGKLGFLSVPNRLGSLAADLEPQLPLTHAQNLWRRTSLADNERTSTEQWAPRRTTARALALRCRIVLTAARGDSNKAVAEHLRVTQPTVGKGWRRFLARRLAPTQRRAVPGSADDDHRCRGRACECQDTGGDTQGFNSVVDAVDGCCEPSPGPRSRGASTAAARSSRCTVGRETHSTFRSASISVTCCWLTS